MLASYLVLASFFLTPSVDTAPSVVVQSENTLQTTTASGTSRSIIETIEATFLPPNIYAGGDVMLSRSVGAKLKKDGLGWITDGYHPFENARKGSFVLLNLESPFSLPDKDEDKPTFLFGSNPANVEVLKWLGKDQMLIVSLANNHVLNAGYGGLTLTLRTLEDAGISAIGLGKNERHTFLQIRRAERLYCFGGYSYDGRSYYDKKTKTTWYVNALSDSKKDIQKMIEDGCDERVFFMHWGSEYRTEPSKKQVELAHTLVDSGATLIIGAHSHIL